MAERVFQWRGVQIWEKCEQTVAWLTEGCRIWCKKITIMWVSRVKGLESKISVWAAILAIVFRGVQKGSLSGGLWTTQWKQIQQKMGNYKKFGVMESKQLIKNVLSGFWNLDQKSVVLLTFNLFNKMNEPRNNLRYLSKKKWNSNKNNLFPQGPVLLGVLGLGFFSCLLEVFCRWIFN